MVADNDGCFSVSLSGVVMTAIILLLALTGGGESSVMEEVPLVAVDAAPTLEIVLVPAEAEVTVEEVEAAAVVLGGRLAALAASGSIAGGATTVVDPSGSGITVRLAEGTMMPGQVAAALRASGYVELVSGIITDLPEPELVGRQIFTSEYVEREDIGSTGETPVFNTLVPSGEFAGATAFADSMGGFAVEVVLTDEGAAALGAFSEENIGEVLAIVVDNTIIAAPVIQTRVSSSFVISGNFTRAEAQALAAQIGAEPLPIALETTSITRMGE